MRQSQRFVSWTVLQTPIRVGGTRGGTWANPECLLICSRRSNLFFPALECFFRFFPALEFIFPGAQMFLQIFPGAQIYFYRRSNVSPDFSRRSNVSPDFSRRSNVSPDFFPRNESVQRLWQLRKGRVASASRICNCMSSPTDDQADD